MNIQPEIKSRCQELLREQEMGRREIRKLISKATDPTRCLEAWGWTFSKELLKGYWSKTFTLPYPLWAERRGRFYVQQTVLIQLGFTDYCIDLWIMPYSRSELTYYVYVSGAVYPPKVKLKIPLILQKIAQKLPKAIASAETEPFYDEVKQEQIEVISGSELIAKIDQVFDEVRKTFASKPW